MEREFLDELRKKLEEKGIASEKIIEKYQRRFRLGREAQMTDEEIIDLLGGVDSIVEKYVSEEKNAEKEPVFEEPAEQKKKIVLDLAYFSEFSIDSVPGSDISFDVEEEALKYIKTEITNSGASIQSINKLKFWNRQNREFSGTMHIGEDALIEMIKIQNVSGDVRSKILKSDAIVITNTSGDFTIDGLSAKEVKITNVSGDFEVEKIASDQLTISTVSGEIELGIVVGGQANLNTVSGDIKIEMAKIDACTADTVSGDITIESADISEENIKTSAVAGHVSISGKAQKSLSAKLKDVFSELF